MPYKFETEKKTVGRENNKNRKLDDSDKELIKSLYKDGDTSQRKLARDFGVSRRLISFILDPKKLEQNRDSVKARGGSKIYYDKDKHSKAMKKHRDYKKELDSQGKLIEKEML